MPKLSAGLLLFRRKKGTLEVFLVHPGGPFWTKKDLGAWSIPKGECAEGELPLEAAKREFREETGLPVDGDPVELGTVKQAGGKLVSVWAMEGDCDPAKLISNMCSIEWPPRSGRKMEIPEVDRGDWFGIEAAQERILKGQLPALDLLIQRVTGEN
jgi:predicted NUDIX family NTP pyrophosphohydrolase